MVDALTPAEEQKVRSIMIAATGKFILDEMTSCTVTKCSNQSVLVCENCGGLMCVNHRKEIDKKEGKKRGCKYSPLRLKSRQMSIQPSQHKIDDDLKPQT